MSFQQRPKSNMERPSSAGRSLMGAMIGVQARKTQVIPQQLVAELEVSPLRRGLSAGKSRPKHTDAKAVFEGLDGASLQAALNHAAQLKTLLSSRGASVASERDVDDDRTPLHWAAARGRDHCGH